jgi:hypothetical protein
MVITVLQLFSLAPRAMEISNHRALTLPAIAPKLTLQGNTLRPDARFDWL